MKLTENELKNLKIILEEYLDIFKRSKKHQKIHKKEPCIRCIFAEKLLKKIPLYRKEEKWEKLI